MAHLCKTQRRCLIPRKRLAGQPLALSSTSPVSRASQVALLARHALARRRPGGAGRRRSLLERELEAVEVVYGALSRAGDAEAVARVLLDEIAELLSVQFVGLALVEEDLREARGLLARADGVDVEPRTSIWPRSPRASRARRSKPRRSSSTTSPRRRGSTGSWPTRSAPRAQPSSRCSPAVA
jgi:hypothetical protein